MKVDDDELFSEVVQSLNVEDDDRKEPGFSTWPVTLVIYEPILRWRKKRKTAPVANYERRRKYLTRTFQRMPFIKRMSDMYLVIKDEEEQWNVNWVKTFKEVGTGGYLSGPGWFVSFDLDLRTHNECKKFLSEIRIPVSANAWIELFKIFDKNKLKRYMNRLNEGRLKNNKFEFIDESDESLNDMIDFVHGIFHKE